MHLGLDRGGFHHHIEIEGKLGHMQDMHTLMQRSTYDIEVSQQRMQQIQQATSQCTADLATVPEQLEGLCAKISLPTW